MSIKNLLYILPLALLLISCEGPMGPEGPEGPAGADGNSTNWKIIDLSAANTDWELQYGSSDKTNPYYTVSFDVPELTDFVYNSGLVQCYQEVNSNGILSQQLLPVVRHYEEYDANNNQTTWTETMDYEYETGKVTVFVTYSDFYMKNTPGDRNFRLVLMW